MKILKKDNQRIEEYDRSKIVKAVSMAGDRCGRVLEPDKLEILLKGVENKLEGSDIIVVAKLHLIIIEELEKVDIQIAQAYKEYRGYKQRFNKTFGGILEDTKKLLYSGSKENANKDSSLVSTKKELVGGLVSQYMALDYELPQDVAIAHKEGYIHSHDARDEIFGSINCCLFDMKSLLKDGFTINGIKNSEPQHLETAMDIISDIILSASSQQFGGFTVPEIDSVMAPYVEKGYNEYLKKFNHMSYAFKDRHAYEKWVEGFVYDILVHGFHNKFDNRLNTINNSNGQTSFTTTTFGLDTSKWGRLVSKAILEARMKGLGVLKVNAIFPKLVFLHRAEINGDKDSPNYDIKELAIECSMQCMYPDWLSLDSGYLGDIYDKYKKAISPMGCVDGQEVITYTYLGNLYVESFERMWGRITSDIKDVGQSRPSDVHRVVDLRNSDVTIYDTLKGFVKVKYLIRNLQDNWCDVTISNGRKLRTTLDHPFETERGTVLAQDLTIDDVVSINTSQYSENSKYVAEDLAWLQGFMLCDGCYGCYQNYSVFASITSEEEDDIEEAFKSAFKNHFGVVPITVLQERGKQGTYKDLRIYSNGATPIKDLISYFTNLYKGVQKKYRHIPNEVFTYVKKSRYAFLAGMIDADGYINNNVKKHKYPTIQIGSTNKELALQQLALAQSLGMRARLYTNHYDVKDKAKIRYRIEFFPNRSLIEAMKCEKKKSKGGYFIEDKADKIMYSHIVDVEPLNMEQYSYDVTTESEHFEVSGVYSHNCRAFLSPWYKKGETKSLDDTDEPVFIGRANCGAVSLNLPRYAIESNGDINKYYELIDKYFWLCVKKHAYKFNKLRGIKASTNPLFFCEGGCHIRLKPNDTIEKAIRTFTWSIGYIGLDEVTQYFRHKGIAQDNTLAIETLQHIRDLIDQAKEKTGLMIALYSTPAESLCYRFATLDRDKYGVIDSVTDKEYYTNSYHCNVKDHIGLAEKQLQEKPMFDLATGGRIVYNEYPQTHNKVAMIQCINFAMQNGLYYGINLKLDVCLDCGQKGEFKDHKCTKCESTNIVEENRVCGYIGYTIIDGDTRMNKGKQAEINDRVDHCE